MHPRCRLTWLLLVCEVVLLVADTLAAPAPDLGFSSPPSSLRFCWLPGALRKCRGSGPALQPAMLLDKVPALKRADLVLASGSPRRKEILNELLGLGVRVVASTFEEDLDKSKFTPETYVQENARLKALEVWERLQSAGESPTLVIGGDTVVAADGRILVSLAPPPPNLPSPPSPALTQHASSGETRITRKRDRDVDRPEREVAQGLQRRGIGFQARWVARGGARDVLRGDQGHVCVSLGRARGGIRGQWRAVRQGRRLWHSVCRWTVRVWN